MGTRIWQLIMFCIVMSPVQAELYRYQDANGRWHFTDRVPHSAKPKAEPLYLDSSHQNRGDNSSSAADSSEQSDQSNQDTGQNLQEHLYNSFKPDTPVEIASIAVVGVESRLGGGSGFFISDQGHIVTNKHVIRPSKKTDDMEQDLADRERDLKKWDARLRTRNKNLMKVAQELEDYKERIYGSNAKPSPVDVADYEYRYEDYKEHKDRYDEQKKDYNKAKQKVDSALRELNWSLSMSKVAKSFKVYTKDQQAHTAQLIYVSEKYDLALLKIDNVTTPNLPQGNTQALSQGQLVFAIGSPLGQRDSVTSGVITRVSRSVVITDAQILPGNSGGPLIDDQGQVVAVNTVKVSQKRGQEGFGHSIPIEVVMREFQSKL